MYSYLTGISVPINGSWACVLGSCSATGFRIRLLLAVSLFGCNSKPASPPASEVKVNGISLGMTKADVEAKLGKGEEIFGGDRPVLDFKTTTVTFNKAGEVTGVDGNSEFGELALQVGDSEFKSLPSGQALGPEFGEPNVQNQMSGTTYSYRTPTICLNMSADGHGHWAAKIFTLNP